MKKSIFIIASLFLSIFTSPLMAQPEDPGVDPAAPAAPIDQYVWVLGIMGLALVFLKIRAIYKQANISLK